MITHQDKGPLNAVILIATADCFSHFLGCLEDLLLDQVEIKSWLTPGHIYTSVLSQLFFNSFDIKLNVFLW